MSTTYSGPSGEKHNALARSMPRRRSPEPVDGSNAHTSRPESPLLRLVALVVPVSPSPESLTTPAPSRLTITRSGRSGRFLPRTNPSQPCRASWFVRVTRPRAVSQVPPPMRSGAAVGVVRTARDKGLTRPYARPHRMILLFGCRRTAGIGGSVGADHTGPSASARRPSRSIDHLVPHESRRTRGVGRSDGRIGKPHDRRSRHTHTRLTPTHVRILVAIRHRQHVAATAGRLPERPPASAVSSTAPADSACPASCPAAGRWPLPVAGVPLSICRTRCP